MSVLTGGATLIAVSLMGQPAAQAAASSAVPSAAVPAAAPAALAGTVALTFDDGPSPTYTPQVLDLLAQHRVRATFCLVGTQVRRYPALVRRIVAEGHAVCNHSMNHDNLSGSTAEQIRADLSATVEVIKAAEPAATVPYYRAPYGAWGQSAAVAAELGMSRLGWSVDPRDWSRPGADAIVQAVRDQLRSGGVVLMHDGGGDRTQTVQALSVLLPELRNEGWIYTLPPVTTG
jgi:chitooligosaccharide deacetylase NodB